MMIYFKEHVTEMGGMVALCDADLIGKIYKENKIIINLDQYADFYIGELMDEAKVSEKLDQKEIYCANVVGKKSVKIFINKGIVSKKDIKTVEGVPFVHVYNVY